MEEDAEVIEEVVQSVRSAEDVYLSPDDLGLLFRSPAWADICSVTSLTASFPHHDTSSRTLSLRCPPVPEGRSAVQADALRADRSATPACGLRRRAERNQRASDAQPRVRPVPLGQTPRHRYDDNEQQQH